LRAGFDRFTPKNLAANKPIVDLLQRFAAKKGATPSQLALAWLLARKPWIVPIPGTRNTDHLRENMQATRLQLAPSEIAELDTAFAKLTVHGERMNESQMEIVQP
jgi:aryl-alcohol dehydrogenase-like predicted oxidoreductase